jgi:hypothetical protein
MTFSSPDLPLRAAKLVLDFQKSPIQAARLLGCSVPALQKALLHYLDEQPQPTNLPKESPPSDFADVRLEEPPVPPIAAFPLEIMTPSGITLRLQLHSLDDLAALLNSLEVASC